MKDSNVIEVLPTPLEVPAIIIRGIDIVIIRISKCDNYLFINNINFLYYPIFYIII